VKQNIHLLSSETRKLEPGWRDAGHQRKWGKITGKVRPGYEVVKKRRGRIVTIKLPRCLPGRRKPAAAGPRGDTAEQGKEYPKCGKC